MSSLLDADDGAGNTRLGDAGASVGHERTGRTVAESPLKLQCVAGAGADDEAF